MTTQPLIIGSGLAGLSVALTLAEAGIPCTILARRVAGGWTSSGWAQGGIAAAIGDDDTPALHAADTIAAGAGLCDPALVQLVTEAAPAAIEQLSAWGVAFDRDERDQKKRGKLKLGLEGAHSRRRIVHAHGHSTGAAIMQALVTRARLTFGITIIENVEVTELLLETGAIAGVVYRDGAGKLHNRLSSQVALATGGVGGLWRHTTNPLNSRGQGLALAARAGAVLRDLEFVQFHPTVLDVGLDPMPLVSEALRGEGAILINDRDEKFLDNLSHGELAARDILVRAIWEQLQQGRRIFLDARPVVDFADRFAAVYEFCRAAKIDPTQQPIPIHPAVHYHMGGVAVDADGGTTVPGLWACGEVAATGLHGANRLASNSLLEAVVMGQRVAENMGVGSLSLGVEEKNKKDFRQKPGVQTQSSNLPFIRSLMSQHVGVLRDKVGLEQAVSALTPLAGDDDAALVALLIATAALQRMESRGSHSRTDFPATEKKWEQHQELRLNDVLSSAAFSTFVKNTGT